MNKRFSRLEVDGFFPLDTLTPIIPIKKEKKERKQPFLLTATTGYKGYSFSLIVPKQLKLRYAPLHSVLTVSPPVQNASLRYAFCLTYRNIELFLLVITFLLLATTIKAQKIHDTQRVGGQAKGYTFKTNKVLGYVYDKNLRYYFLGGDSVAVNTFDYQTLKGSVTVPATITYNKKKYRIVKLKDCAFEKQYRLDSITLPPSIKHIPPTCFYWCNHLKYINAPGLETIGAGSFRYTRIERVVIPNGVKRVCHDAFIQCSATKYVELPENEIELGDDAFGYCNHIDTVKVHYRHPIKFNERAFWTDAELHNSTEPRQRIVLLCPKGTADEYRTADGWRYFWGFVEYE